MFGLAPELRPEKTGLPPQKTASGSPVENPDKPTYRIDPRALISLPLQPPMLTESGSGRGVWLSADPIGEMGGMNLYGYVGNDPINGSDELGLIGGWGSSAFHDQYFAPGKAGEDFRRGFNKVGGITCGIGAALGLGGAAYAAAPGVTVAVGGGGRKVASIPGFHVSFSAAGRILHGSGKPFVNMRIMAARAKGYFDKSPIKIKIPVLSEKAAMGVEGSGASLHFSPLVSRD